MLSTLDMYDGSVLSRLHCVTEKEVFEQIVKAPTKSCMLDPIPTALTKKYLADLVPAIPNIVNTSLSTVTVPSQSNVQLLHHS